MERDCLTDEDFEEETPFADTNDTMNDDKSQLSQLTQKMPEKKKKRRFNPKPIMNIHYTQYPIIKIQAKEIGFRCRTDDVNILALAG